MVAAGDTAPRTSAKSQSGSTLSGIVLSQGGTPQPDVLVTLRRGDVAVGECRTEADGVFRFLDLPLGVYSFTIPTITFAGIALDGVATRNLKLTYGAGIRQRYAVATQRLLPETETGGRRILYGVVTDVNGAGLSGVKVQMRWTDPAPGTQFPVEIAGSRPDKPSGYFELVTTPGVYALSIVDADWPSDVAEDLNTHAIPGREGQPISYEVNFRLQPVPLARIEGSAPGLRPGSRAKLLGATVPGGEQVTPLDSELRFTFAGLPPGRYRLELEKIGVVADNIVLDSGGLFKFVFPVRSQIRGQARGARDGLMAVLHAPPPWGWTRQAVLDQAGRFRFGDLPAGRYRLRIADAEPFMVELTGENQVELAPIDLLRGHQSVLHGVVADRAGQPQADIELSLWRDGEVIARTETADDGIFRFAHLPAGAYTLHVLAMGAVLSDLVLDGEAEHRHEVTWRLGAITGRLMGADGRPQQGQTVRLFRAHDEIGHTETSEDGAFRFVALADGVYRLAPDAGVAAAAEVSIAEGSTVSQDLRLSARKPLAHYLLLAPETDDQQEHDTAARLTLALILPYLQYSGATGGFALDEAQHAAQVTVIGRRLSPAEEAGLQAAGCRVSQLPADLNALAVAIDRLLAETGRG